MVMMIRAIPALVVTLLLVGTPPIEGQTAQSQTPSKSDEKGEFKGTVMPLDTHVTGDIVPTDEPGVRYREFIHFSAGPTEGEADPGGWTVGPLPKSLPEGLFPRTEKSAGGINMSLGNFVSTSPGTGNTGLPGAIGDSARTVLDTILSMIRANTLYQHRRNQVQGDLNRARRRLEREDRRLRELRREQRLARE